MHACSCLAGPGVQHLTDVAGLRPVDIAPTLSFLMGIPGPQNARGAILYDIDQGTGDSFREVTILDVSDWQRPADPACRGVLTRSGPTVRHRSAPAFYKTWFDIYEAEAARAPEVEGLRGHGWRLLRRSDASDLELLRGQAHSADHGDDGHRRGRDRQPQLRSRGTVPAQHADPAGPVPDDLLERRSSR
jgi:hypothetical protein